MHLRARLLLPASAILLACCCLSALGSGCRFCLGAATWRPTSLKTPQQHSSSAGGTPGNALCMLCCACKFCASHGTATCRHCLALPLPHPVSAACLPACPPARLPACRNASFLPSAFIMGLQPGARVDAEVGSLALGVGLLCWPTCGVQPRLGWRFKMAPMSPLPCPSCVYLACRWLWWQRMG
jgi:hypothetical protein